MSNEETTTCVDGVDRPVSECVEYDGDWYPLAECVLVDGDHVPKDQCQQAYDGEWYLADDLVRLENGDFAHTDDDNICHCYDGEYRYTDDCSVIDDEWYPDHMVRTCEICCDAVLRNDMYSGPGGDLLCDNCYAEHVYECYECGCEMWSEDRCTDDDGDSFCEECFSSRSLIRSYSDKSANRLRPESRDRLLFGIELEVEAKVSQEAGAEWVREHLPDTYCVLKNDSSLSSSGFEIVTRPDSMAVHKRKFAALLDNDPGKRLRSWIGGRCGMHVHVTKSALTQLQLAKIMCFLNDPDNASFVSTVAGRLPCSWCRVSPKKLSDVRRAQERYVALNITSRTAEFRIFRGTLLGSSFRKNLEFVEALVDYCGPAQRSIQESLSHSDFCRWLDKKLYPNLHAYLQAKGYASLLARQAA